MLLSVWYVISFSAAFLAVFLAPKSEKKLNGVLWLLYSGLALVCWNSVAAGIIKFFCGVRLDVFAVSYLLPVLVSALSIRKNGVQKYDWHAGDAAAVLLLMLMAFLIGWVQFDGGNSIGFMITDPATIFNSSYASMKEIGFMYYIRVQNALLFEVLSPWFTRIEMVRPYIWVEVFRFGMAGACFYALLRTRSESGRGKLLAFAAAVGCMLGYPLTNLLYGFTYLQHCVTLSLYVLGLTVLTLNDTLRREWSAAFLCGGFLTVAVGYVLFVPPLFISTLARFAWKAWREKTLLTLRYVQDMLAYYLLPCVYGLAFSVFSNDSPITGGVSTMEGPNYKMLYGNFLFLLPFAVCGIAALFHRAGKDPELFALPITTLFVLGLIVMGAMGQMSTYYSYKAHFLLWPLLWAAAYWGLLEVHRRLPGLPFLLFGAFFLTLTLRAAGLYVDSGEVDEVSSLVDVYDYNISYLSDPYGFLDEDALESYEKAAEWNEAPPDEPLRPAGTGLYTAWYNALLGEDKVFLLGADLSQRFLDGEFGEYAMVFYLQEGLQPQDERLWNEQEIIWENDAARLVRIVNGQ